MDVVYFELNNWFCGRDYPENEKFIDWIGTLKFANDDWVKENKLVVTCGNIDMSMNYCITAPREWVENNCPELLSDDSYEYEIMRMDEIITYTRYYKDFLRYPDNEYLPEGRHGMPFREYTEDNIGIEWWEEDYD